jgi:iron(III) transport system substrate-binding protein
MKRYAPIFLLSLCLVMVAFVGSLLLSGHADEKTEEFLPEIVIYTTLPAETVQSLLTEEAQKQGLKLQVRSFTASADLLKQLQQEQQTPQASFILTERMTLLRAKKEKRLQEFLSEEADLVSDSLKDEDDFWVGLWYDPYVFVVNKDAAKQWKNVPNDWEDIVKQSDLRVAMTDFLAAEAPAQLMEQLNEVYGSRESLAYLAKLHPQVVRYAKFLSTPVRMAGMGEADLAITPYSEAEKYVRDQFPVQLVWPEHGTAYMLTGGALVKGGPMQSEAKKMLDWLLSPACAQKREAISLLALPANPEIQKSPRPVLWELRDEALPEGTRQKQLEAWLQNIRLGLKAPEGNGIRLEEQKK